MVECVHDSLTAPLKYVSYGCFCGKGSAGNTPVDASDRCCQAHDHCYEAAHSESIGCSSFDVYGILYKYSTSHDASGQCLVHCAPVADYPADQEGAACMAYLCECDHNLTQCLKEVKDSYNADYREYRYSEAGREHCV
ncbi:phospholipase A2 AP-PLA2-II-like [Patiria miniata]|uniref:Phospholipase A2-like central domain-containing protein n=1 Tax=Patiria miniata TaxID=46514 RepID=A0A913ZD47_PATMI|nr:phospholipase A2 AP-PLA2-II-like [Patiria miniata]